MNSTAGVIWALVSALTWGTADFAGGLASRRAHSYQILALSATSGVVMLIVIAVMAGETIPSGRDCAWAAGAGLCGALGIASLYRGLATGSAAVVAPTAGVITAALPVIFNIATGGWPAPLQMLGFAIAAVGIWLVAQGTPDDRSRTAGLRAALLAGTGFGFFLILIAQVSPDLVFAPLAIGRVFTLAAACALLAIARVPPIPPRTAWPIGTIAGALDAGGNVFYLFARQDVRLDIAAVLSSFYPVATVVLARIVLKEPVRPTQWLGALACMAAIGLVTR